MAERRMKRFSDEQIDRAKRVDVVEYARSVGLEIEKSGNWYKAKGQGGLYFNRKGNTWHWETHDTGGRDAISLCMEFENKTWVEAVKTLLGEEMEAIRYNPDWKPEPEPPKEFHLPDRNYTYRHMFAYLTKTRGIDPGILKVLVDRGYIYENTKRSCVFVGRDKDGTAKHASVRSTNTEGKTFKQDVPGSQKAYSFSISGKSGVLNVFEAPIDALSYISLQKLYGKQMKDSYVALGGVTDKALERFLTEHTDVEKIRVCTDNDQAGEMAALRIKEQYGDKYTVIRHRPTHKDFNEDLVTLRYQERMKEQDIEKENIGQMKAENSMILQQAGISQKVIDWYQGRQDTMPLSAEHFQIKGTSSILFVCENPVEVFSVMELRMRIYQEQYGKDDYVSNDNYLVYSDMEQFNSYMQEHQDIKNVCLCGGNTAGGQRLNKEIAEGITGGKQVTSCEPEMNTYSELLAMQKAVVEVMEQTPVNDQQSLEELDMVAGMEM